MQGYYVKVSFSVILQYFKFCRIDTWFAEWTKLFKFKDAFLKKFFSQFFLQKC